MKNISEKYPVDILLCAIFSLILLLVIIIDPNGVLRIVLGLPFILFIPGYVLVFALFPTKKTDKGIDNVERIALSLGLSIAVVSLIGIGLNYSPFDIQLGSGFLTVFIFIISFGGIGFYRWHKTNPNERYVVVFDIKKIQMKSVNKYDKMLSIILIISIMIAAIFFIYSSISTKEFEKSTEFYLLGEDGKAEGYPQNLSLGENASVIIGIINNEYQTIDYTVEIWLVNHTNNAWFMDKISVTLDNVATNKEKKWLPQWEYNYTFSINKTWENLELVFLLYKGSTDDYDHNFDYKSIIEQKINDSYEELHIWVNVI
jgi:uncharacterized membrane protein